MVTLNMINQYALDNNLSDDTDIFYILSQMKLDCREDSLRTASTSLPSPPSSGTDFTALVEYSTQDLLNLLST